MGNIFRKEREEARKTPKMTDKKGFAIFTSVRDGISDSRSAQAVYEKANGIRLGSVVEQHEAAYSYFALAMKMAVCPDIKIDSGNIKAPLMFHFAGHAFREIGQLKRAAEAYRYGGVLDNKKGYPGDFGIRSLARAKSCYAEIGESEKSDSMHVLEWEARRHGRKLTAPFLFLWKITSKYGTSLGVWLVWLVLLMATFTVAYEALHRYKCIADSHTWTPFLTAAYYCIVTTATVGYGEIVPTSSWAQVVVAVNIVLAYAFLAVGATILGRKVIGR